MFLIYKESNQGEMDENEFAISNDHSKMRENNYIK